MIFWKKLKTLFPFNGLNNNMQNKSFHKLFVVVLLLFSVISCNRVEKDAKKSAKYTNQSIEQARELDFENAEKSYNKSKEINWKYEDKGKKTDKFNKLYKMYRDKDKYESPKTQD